MDNKKAICSTCEYCEKDENNDFICVNYDSEYVADFVDENHFCEEWVGRKCE